MNVLPLPSANRQNRWLLTFFFYRPRSGTQSKLQMGARLPFGPAAIGNMRRHAGPRAQGSGSAISIDLITSFVLK